jgi:endonuclease/exonuclease/phosphatase family metal-dependent hydrolase
MKRLLGFLWFCARLVVLGGLYGLVRALGWALAGRARALLTVSAVALVVGLAAPRGCVPGRGPLKVATFNIRRFGVEPTDMALLTRIVGDVGADVVAVQEIQSVEKLDELARALSGPGRRYAHTLASCGGRSEMLVGFLYDAARVKLKKTREFNELDPDGNGRCTEGERAGLLGVFEAGGRTVNLVVVHLSAGGEPEKAEKRREQWARVMRIVDRLRSEGAKDIAVLGDANSTGFLDNRHGERDYIRQLVTGRGLELPTGELACSEYWVPRAGAMEPSMLDHVVATPGLARAGSAAVHGYCEALRCRPHRLKEAPDDYVRVSDHCPVSFSIAPLGLAAQAWRLRPRPRPAGGRTGRAPGGSRSA